MAQRKPDYFYSAIFQSPQCLISTGDNNVLKVEKDVLDQISQIEEILVVIAIAGLYRTGKSFLMNRIANEDTGFALGDTIESTTKGIWAWCKVHPERENTVILLLDTEGLGDLDKGDPSHDNRLFTLVALLCSTLIYNQKNAFDQDAISKLTFVSEIAQSIRFNGRCDENNSTLQCILPGFVLVLRDFFLKLEKNGRRITPDEYLEDCLEPKAGKREEFNKPREAIRRFFPQHQRKCFTLPVPGDGDVLEHLDDLPFSALSNKFKEAASILVSFIYKTEPKCILLGKDMNGQMFAKLTEEYVNAFAKGAVPDVDDAFTAVAKIENESVKKKAITNFESAMSFIVLPLSYRIFHRRYQDAERSALQYLRDNAVYDKGHRVEKEAQNEEEILKHCQAILNSLQGKKELDGKIENKHFEKPGGHKLYKRSLDTVKQQYELALNDFESREIAVTWSTYQKVLNVCETKIIDIDESLTQKEKDDEKKESDRRIKQLKKDMEDNHRKALEEQRQANEEYHKNIAKDRDTQIANQQKAFDDLQSLLTGIMEKDEKERERIRQTYKEFQDKTDRMIENERKNRQQEETKRYEKEQRLLNEILEIKNEQIERANKRIEAIEKKHEDSKEAFKVEIQKMFDENRTAIEQTIQDNLVEYEPIEIHYIPVEEEDEGCSIM